MYGILYTCDGLFPALHVTHVFISVLSLAIVMKNVKKKRVRVLCVCIIAL